MTTWEQFAAGGAPATETEALRVPRVQRGDPAGDLGGERSRREPSEGDATALAAAGTRPLDIGTRELRPQRRRRSAS